MQSYFCWNALDNRLGMLKNFIINEVDSHTVQHVFGEQQAFQQIFLRTGDNGRNEPHTGYHYK